MSRQFELERQVLVALIRDRTLLDADERLTSGMFSSGLYRKLYAQMTKAWENGRESPNEGLLAVEEGIAVTDVTHITDGCPVVKMTPDNFRLCISRLLSRRTGERILRLSQVEAEAFVKTGEIDPEKLRELGEAWREIEDLEGSGQVPAFKRLSEIEGRSIDWLWHGRIPLGMISLCAGDPGLGKSFLATWLASRLSIGAVLPGDPGPALNGSTIYLSAEDSPAYALRPRAAKNGADLEKIMVLEDSTFDITADLEKIRGIVKKDPKVRLLVVDPLNSYLGGADYLKDPDVRAMLNPLIGFAEDSGIAVLVIMHLNKKTDQAGIYRIGGSIAFAGVARSILAVTQDPEDRDRRLLRPLKMNYARKPDPLAFRIGEDLLLTFDDGPVDVDQDESLSPPTGREAVEGNFAVEWLAGHLAAGAVDLKDILTSAKELKISQSALYRAKDRLKARSRSFGFGKGRSTSWELPNDSL